jgi:hypothetical protein
MMQPIRNFFCRDNYSRRLYKCSRDRFLDLPRIFERHGRWLEDYDNPPANFEIEREVHLQGRRHRAQGGR